MKRGTPRIASTPRRPDPPDRAQRTIDVNQAMTAQRLRDRLPNPNPRQLVREGTIEAYDSAAETVAIAGGPVVPWMTNGFPYPPRVGDRVLYLDDARRPQIVSVDHSYPSANNSHVDIKRTSETINWSTTVTTGWAQQGSTHTYSAPFTWVEWDLLVQATVEWQITASDSFYAAARLDVNGNGNPGYFAFDNHIASTTSNVHTIYSRRVNGLTADQDYWIEAQCLQIGGFTSPTLTLGRVVIDLLAIRIE